MPDRKIPVALQSTVSLGRRSSNNLYYDLADVYNKCAPYDNIHPTFGSSEHYFSSFGCQTIIGSADSAGHHMGSWAKFRALAGLATPSGTPGAQYLYMLVTGREAYLAADLRRKKLATDNASLQVLRRLRFGSRGPEIAMLQQKLGDAQPDGDFGPETSRLVHERQRSGNPNASDGIYSPKLDSQLGWGVFSAHSFLDLSASCRGAV
jgi:endonuclease G